MQNDDHLGSEKREYLRPIPHLLQPVLFPICALFSFFGIVNFVTKFFDTFQSANGDNLFQINVTLPN